MRSVVRGDVGCPPLSTAAASPGKDDALRRRGSRLSREPICGREPHCQARQARQPDGTASIGRPRDGIVRDQRRGGGHADFIAHRPKVPAPLSASTPRMRAV
jgi:hypothetical protein